MYFQEPERPVASIIQEIVIYDKPNFRNASVANKTDRSPAKKISHNLKNVTDCNRPAVDVSIKVENVEEATEPENELYPDEDQDTSTEQEDSKCGVNFLHFQNDTNCPAPVVEPENTILLKKYEDEDESVNKQAPFKRPRGRPKKSLTSKKPNEDKKVESTEEPGPPRRGRPKKVQAPKSEQANDANSEKKETVQAKKRGRKRKIYEDVFNQSGGGDNSHNGQKGDVEAEIESMFNAVEEAENAATQDQENDDEEYDSEDSRQEWIPEEYVEYKQQHLRKMNKKTFPCKFCKTEFSSYYAVRKHRALEHNDVGKDRKESEFGDTSHDDLDQMGSSDEEGDVGSDNESLAEWMPDDYAQYKMKHSQHKMRRSQWYKCKICCAVFSNYYKLSKHKFEHRLKPNPYECNQCKDKFKDIDLLMAHIRMHQGKDPYQCKKCDKGFSAKEELDKHILIHVLKKKPTVKRFKCDVCSKEFSKLCDLERHTRVHTGEKPCECSICHKRFQQAHNLSKHLLIHLHVKPFQCEICNKKFGRIDVLNRHILTHSMEKPFKCGLCGRGFIRQVQLSNHQKKHHPGAAVDDVDILS